MKKIDDAINIMRKGDPSLLTEEDVMMGRLALMQTKSLKDIISAAITKQEEPGRFSIAKISLDDQQMKEMVNEAISNLESSVQPEQRWILCKERLPESDCKTILVTGKMKYAFEKEYEYFVDCAFVESIHGTPDNFSPFDFETWNDWYEGQDEYYILAWMPLPEPYKENK